MSPTPELRRANTVGVSDWFHFDWQYIVDFLRIPFLKEASAVIVAMPALVDIGWLERLLGEEVSFSIWLTWLAALLYILFFLVGYLACPRFIREYRDFGEYLKRSHSNRFIGWELSKVFNEETADSLLEELKEKGLVEPKSTTEQELIDSGVPTRNFGAIRMYGPNNIGVDLCIYFVRDSMTATLYLPDGSINQEDTVQRNIFWIIYSKLAKSRPKWRTFTWLLFSASVILYVISLVWNVIKAIA